MIIRPGHMSDSAQLTEILNAVIAIGGTTAYLDPVEASFFDPLINSGTDKTFLHVAETETKLLGMQWVRVMELGDMGSIATFARPDTVQRGIGTALFQATLAASRAAGYGQLDATIRADNTGGLAYYSKMGFEDHSVTKAKPLSDGTVMDRIHKRLKIDLSH
jgi:L-amino acid N-acyltransferase YncA